jgi:hypothetical protein
VYRVECGNWPVGRHSIPLDLTAMNLSLGTYAFQVEAQADAYKAVDVRQISFQGY